MFFKKIIAVNVIVLGLVCVGCTTTDVDSKDLSTTDTNVETTTTEDSSSNDIDKEVNNEKASKENEVSENNDNNKFKEENVTTTNKKKETVEVINEETGEITEEEEVQVVDLTPDKDYYFPDLAELPQDIQEWVLANKDNKKEISAYVKTTSDATYVLASVENDTGGKVAMIHTPYTISDSDEWVVPYSYMKRDKWIDSDGNEYLIMKTNKPVKVRLEHATIYEN